MYHNKRQLAQVKAAHGLDKRGVALGERLPRLNMRMIDMCDG
jgi:hypothetical protein